MGAGKEKVELFLAKIFSDRHIEPVIYTDKPRPDCMHITLDLGRFPILNNIKMKSVFEPNQSDNYQYDVGDETFIFH